MALSGRNFLAGALAAVTLLVASACGSPPVADPARSATLPPAGDTIDLHEARAATVGQPVTPEGAKVLPLGPNEAVQPVGEWDGRILLSARVGATAETSVSRLSAWDPETGGASELWESTPGTQDVVAAVEGDWAAIVRTGHEMPFPEWVLQLRNLRTGDVRTLAQSDAAVAEVSSLQPGLPLGFAPFPSLVGGKVVWAEYVTTGDAVFRQVVLYDLETEEHSVLAAADVEELTIDSPSVGGERVAWVESTPEATKANFVVVELATGQQRRIAVDGIPFVAVLSADGEHIAWDHEMRAKLSYDIERDELVAFGTDEGWGVFAAGDRVAWAPAAAYGGTGGFFDHDTDTLRVIPRREGVTTNVALVLPHWFAWQESGPDGAAYYFLPLESQTDIPQGTES